MCGTTEASGITSGMSSTSTIPTTVNSSCCSTTSRERKIQKAIDHIRTQFNDHPRTKEEAWHKKIYPWQVWLMVVHGPALLRGIREVGPGRIRYSTTSPVNSSTLNAIPATQKTGLLYHGWDEAKKQKWPIRKPVVRPISGAGPLVRHRPWWM